MRKALCLRGAQAGRDCTAFAEILWEPHDPNSRHSRGKPVELARAPWPRAIVHHEAGQARSMHRTHYMPDRTLVIENRDHSARNQSSHLLQSRDGLDEIADCAHGMEILGADLLTYGALDAQKQIDGVDTVDFELIEQPSTERHARRVDFEQLDERSADQIVNLCRAVDNGGIHGRPNCVEYRVSR